MYLICNWGQMLVMINFWASVFWNRKPCLLLALARITFFGCWGTERKKKLMKNNPFQSPVIWKLQTYNLVCNLETSQEQVVEMSSVHFSQCKYIYQIVCKILRNTKRCFSKFSVRTHSVSGLKTKLLKLQFWLKNVNEKYCIARKLFSNPSELLLTGKV